MGYKVTLPYGYVCIEEIPANPPPGAFYRIRKLSLWERLKGRLSGTMTITDSLPCQPEHEAEIRLVIAEQHDYAETYHHCKFTQPEITVSEGRISWTMESL